MISNPKWLPLKINTDGVWEKVLIKLYKVFNNDFKKNKCHFDIWEITFDNRKIDSSYEEGFWHLISKYDYTINHRVPDFPRAQKLTWCRPVIENHSNKLIKCWEFEEKNKRIRIYIWLEVFNYVVIIEKRKRSAYLVSAFHVSGESSRLRLSRKYLKRIVI